MYIINPPLLDEADPFSCFAVVCMNWILHLESVSYLQIVTVEQSLLNLQKTFFFLHNIE